MLLSTLKRASPDGPHRRASLLRVETQAIHQLSSVYVRRRVVERRLHESELNYKNIKPEASITGLELREPNTMSLKEKYVRTRSVKKVTK